MHRHVLVYRLSINNACISMHNGNTRTSQLNKITFSQQRAFVLLQKRVQLASMQISSSPLLRIDFNGKVLQDSPSLLHTQAVCITERPGYEAKTAKECTQDVTSCTILKS